MAEQYADNHDQEKLTPAIIFKHFSFIFRYEKHVICCVALKKLAERPSNSLQILKQMHSRLRFQTVGK